MIYKRSDYYPKKIINELEFSILNLQNESCEIITEHKETALLLLEGEANFQFHQENIKAKRKHWKDENPSVFHLAPNEKIQINTPTQCRMALIQTHNENTFASKFYSPESISTEHRGKGILEDTCYRLVRTVFDHSTAPKEAKLVLGEVINFSGRWSSYPPHHHEQEEIYYYELEPKYGFGFGQCGDDVFKIEHQDLLHIPGGKDHSQVSAPGYDLYYIWAIRHGAKAYTGFEFTKPYDEVIKKS